MSETFRVSDQTIETAARAIHDVEYGDQPEHADCDWSDMRDVWVAYARAAVAAVLPSLVAEIRELVASEIRSQAEFERQPTDRCAMQRAARIARGGVL